MALNDFEHAAPLDLEEEITSTGGNIVNNYLASKGSLDTAMSDALNSSYDFGYLMGMKDERLAVIGLLRVSGLEAAAKFLEESDD